MNESLKTAETNSGLDPGPLPPFRFCVAAGLCLIAGLNGIMEMVGKALLDTFWLDFSFVGIPIGYGILIGRTSSRVFGLIFSALPVLVLATIILWNFSGGNADLRTILPFEHPAEVAWLVVLLAASIYVFYVLIGPGQPKWKTSPDIDYRPATRLAWMISIIVAVPLFLSHLTQFSIRERSGRLFAIQVTVTAYDLESNHHLGRIEFMGDAFSVRQNRSLLAPQLRYTSSPGERGIEATIRGVSYRPVEITIGSEGYRDQVLILDQNTPPRLHLGLERLPPTSLEQVTSPKGEPGSQPIDP